MYYFGAANYHRIKKIIIFAAIIINHKNSFCLLNTSTLNNQ